MTAWFNISHLLVGSNKYGCIHYHNKTECPKVTALPFSTGFVCVSTRIVPGHLLQNHKHSSTHARKKSCHFWTKIWISGLLKTQKYIFVSATDDPFPEFSCVLVFRLLGAVRFRVSTKGNGFLPNVIWILLQLLVWSLNFAPCNDHWNMRIKVYFSPCSEEYTTQIVIHS